jgi:hypothetical protein
MLLFSILSTQENLNSALAINIWTLLHPLAPKLDFFTLNFPLVLNIHKTTKVTIFSIVEINIKNAWTALPIFWPAYEMPHAANYKNKEKGIAPYAKQP